MTRLLTGCLAVFVAMSVMLHTTVMSCSGFTAMGLVAAEIYEGEVVEDVSVFAGTGSHGAADGEMAQFNLPFGITVTGDGNVLVADSFNNLIRKVDPYGYTATFAGLLLEMGEFGFPIGAYHDDTVYLSMFYRPTGIAVNSDGWIFIADMGNHAIRVIIGGEVFTFAGGLGQGYENGYDALFNRPTAIAIDENDYLFVADTGNHVIRKISPVGYTSTMAGLAGTYGFRDGNAGEALFDSPMGLAFGWDSALFVADSGNHLIRKIVDGMVMTFAGNHTYVAAAGVSGTYGLQTAVHGFAENHAYTPTTGTHDDWSGFVGGFADGTAQEALFNHPTGLAFWEGLLLVADSHNHSIRAIDSEGSVTTVAGTGYPDHIGGSFREAAFHFPSGIAVYGDRLFVADTGNNMVRVLELRRMETGEWRTGTEDE